ncbi:MAG TPA: arginase [Candidatus Saccharimonadales bacterium]|nr:arginase [Candidatus Saccharimonadales bacterium]
MTKASLIGVPLDLGAENLGVDIGPNAFRYQNLIRKLATADLEVHDLGNITVGERKKIDIGNPRLKYAAEIIRVNEELARKTEDAIRDGCKAIVLGGDHSLTLGTVSGASAAVEGNIGVIYFDAHGDMNTDETTLSGNIHGMHLASLMGFGSKELAHAYNDTVKLPKQNLLHIGGSDFDPAELELIEQENLQAFTLFDLLRSNLSPLLDMIDALAARVPNIWISLDLDCIDRIYAPGAGMPNPKGLTYREIATIAEYIGKKCNVVGVDVVEYNPLQDEQNKTAELGIELIAKFLGHEYSWYTGYMSRNELSQTND